MDFVDDIINTVFPFLEEGATSMLLLLVGCFSIILILSSFRHFHHFTFGTFFMITAVIFFISAINSSGIQAETASFLFYINLIMGIFFIALDFEDLKEFIKPSDTKQALYCKHYSNCPCGCNYGFCSVKNEWITKRELDTCDNFVRAKNLRWRLF